MPKTLVPSLALLWGMGIACTSWADIPTLDELYQMNVETSTASMFPQKKMNTPAAVTVISADDIKDYGYRTLADVLRSVRGVYLTNDRTYEYFGARGFSRSGDYNARLLLMLDGRRLNDVVYDQAFLGTEGIVDLENVERIEFVPGPASAMYGSSAFFGVMNIISKKGAAIKGHGVELAGGFGSYGSDREKITLGRSFDNGADLLLSASRYSSNGHNKLAYGSLADPQAMPFVSRRLDGDAARRLLGKFNYHGFTLESAYSDRIKDVPTARDSVDIGSDEDYRDRNGFVEARYEHAFNSSITSTAKAFWGFYNFDGNFVHESVPNQDWQHAQWWGTELNTRFDLEQHTLIVGSEYQSNFKQQMRSYDTAPYQAYLEVDRTSHRYGFYLQDEFRMADQWTLNAGARYDYYSVSGATANPRLGLIYKPIGDLAVKLLYGTAFRAPNLYELYYFDGITQTPPHELKPEHIASYEAVLEYHVNRQLRLTTTGFYNDVTDLINLRPDPTEPGKVQYHNFQQVTMYGTELEGEYRWRQDGFLGNARLRGSYTYAYAQDASNGSWLENSPRHLGKLNFTFPLTSDDKLRAGTEVQYVGARKSVVGTADGYALVNLTLTANRLVPDLDLSFSVYNLLDKRYTAVAGRETVLDQISQDGLNYRVWMTYAF